MVSNQTLYDEFEAHIRSNAKMMAILKRAQVLGLTNYYIGAGCIAQFIWNIKSGYEAFNGIKDIDFVYFDNNLSEKEEDKIISQIVESFSDMNLDLDVKNEARVHLWYKEKFGYDIEPYTCLESAIRTWPTTATSIGIRLEGNNQITIFAPFGIEDLMGMIVRPNKVQITEEIYINKVKRWTQHWPSLSVVSW